MSFDKMASVPGLAHFIGFPNLANAGTTADAMASAYSYGTSGVSQGFMLPVPDGATQLTDIYVLVDTLVGTAANIKLRVEVRNMSTVTAGKPDTTVYGTEDFQVFSTAPRWYRLQFAAPVSLPSAGTPIGVVWGNVTPTPGSNWLSIHRVGMQNLSGLFNGSGIISRILSSNGWTTANAPLAMTMPVIMKFDNGLLLGTNRAHVNLTWTNYTSNQRERGLYIPASGYDQRVGACVFAPSTNFSGLKIYKDTTAPGSTPGTGELAMTFTGFEKINGVAYIPSSFYFSAGQAYRAVLTYGANAAAPQYMTQTDYGRYPDVDSQNWLCDPLSPYGTIDNGSGGWTDSPEVMPRMGFILENWPALASGGSAGIITHPGMLGI